MNRSPQRSPAKAEHVSVGAGSGTDQEWDEFVRSAPGGTFCHLSGWRSVVSDALGHEAVYREARGVDGSLQGVLPLVRVRAAPFGDFLLSMPFLNYGGALGSTRACAELVEDAVEIARSERVDLLEIRDRGEDPPPGLTRVSRKVTVTLDLPENADELWKDGLKAKVRSQVRRPMKEGMTTRFGPEQVAPFYRVFSRNMRDLGTPVLPRRFFESLARTFPGEVAFGCVYLGDDPVAAGCGFHWAEEFEMTWASSLREHNRSAPNMLLYWAFMERAIQRGDRVFNFGRCTPDSGTHRFKRQWGGADEPLPWGQWSPGGVNETPNPDRPIFRVATRLWRRLPLAVANRLGPLVARRLP